jgi:DNA gyrase subunit A
MRLARLTALEVDKIEEELKEVRAEIKGLRALLESRPKRMALMKSELSKIVEKYGDERRTEITSDQGDFTIEDLIAEEDMVVTVSHSGYIKRTSITTYRAQRRGGKGLTGQELRDEDFVERLYVGSTHDYILVFTNDGAVTGSRSTRFRRRPRDQGQADRQPDQRVARHADPGDGVRARVQGRRVLLFCTRKGTIKKTKLSEYSNSGRRASRRSRSRKAMS